MPLLRVEDDLEPRGEGHNQLPSFLLPEAKVHLGVLLEQAPNQSRCGKHKIVELPVIAPIAMVRGGLVAGALAQTVLSAEHVLLHHLAHRRVGLQQLLRQGRLSGMLRGQLGL